MAWSLRWSLSLSSAVDGQSLRALSSNAFTTSSLSALTITSCIELFHFRFLHFQLLHLSHSFSLSFAGVSLALFSVLSVRIRFSPSNITAAIVPILFCRYYNILLFRSIAPTCAINFNVLKLFFLFRCFNLSALSIVFCEL